MKVKNPCIGSICESLQGRDKGTSYVIVGILPNSFVLVADGNRKKLGSPKRKNLKHLHILPQNVGDYGVEISEKANDCQIAYALKLSRKAEA